MSICIFDIPLKDKKRQGMVYGILFLILSVAVYAWDIRSTIVSFAMGLLACIAIILSVAVFENKLGKSTRFLAKYTMPIFLMHTLFAAPLRAVLMKMGVGNAIIHVVLGLGISFAGPIVAAWVMKKTKWLEFFLYPNKFIRL